MGASAAAAIVLADRRAIETAECRLDRAATNLPVVHADGTERVVPARFVFLTDARDVAEPAGGGQAWGPVLAVEAR